MLPTELVKELTQESWGKVGNRNSLSCLEEEKLEGDGMEREEMDEEEMNEEEMEEEEMEAEKV